jgi:hypothetical protein
MAERTGHAPSQQGIQITGNSTAPFVVFDGVLALGHNGGMAEFEVVCRTWVVERLGGATTPEVVVTGHLRCPITALASLKDAIQKIEMMLTPTDGSVN